MSIPNKMKFMPDIVNICVDEIKNEEVAGRLFHCYNNEAIPFHTVLEAVNEMEKLYDMIRYPQASVRARKFVPEDNAPYIEKEKQVLSGEDVIAFKGEKATFFIVVTARMHASWQGEIYWAEQDELQEFTSDIELLALLDTALKNEI